MALKRLSMFVLIVVMAGMLYGTVNLEKKEILELGYDGGSVYFTAYAFKGVEILTASQHGSIPDIVNISRSPADRQELIGKLKSGAEEYAVVVFQDRICLYSIYGELKSQYKADSNNAGVISCCIADIDGDSAEELLVIEGSGREFYGNKLVLLTYDNGLKKLYDREFKELNPWKIQTCDVDGDGRLEIALGVYKEANFHPVMAKRPFLYQWDKGDIVPVWRGSRLSRPFEDYIFYDLDADGKDELIAIEILSEGKELINAYSWKGFGFESIAESGNYEDIIEIVKQYKGKESLLIKVKEGEGQTWAELEKLNEKLVEKAESNKIIINK